MNIITILRGLVIIDDEHAKYFNQVVPGHLTMDEAMVVAEGILADYKGQRIERLELLTSPDWEYDEDDE